MNKTIYAIIKNTLTGEEKAHLSDFEELNKLLFSPIMEQVFIMDFVIHGKTYKEKKSCLECMAIEYSHNCHCDGLYMSDIIAINNFFETNGKRYGLLTDFHENCIC